MAARYYKKTVKKIYNELSSSLRGLTTGEAGRRLHKYGYNELPSQKPPSLLSLAFRQIKSPLIYILLIAALITFFLNHLVDTYVILAAVLVNTILGFIQEYKAEASLEALKNIFTPNAKVKRDGNVLEIEAKYLVPGDVIILEPGRKVPSDARLINTVDLLINEAPLTGESIPVKKNVNTITKKKTVIPLGDRKNMVYWGTGVVSGFGEAIVVGTGLNSELGKIAGEIADSFSDPTPLQISLGRFSKKLAVVVFILTLAIFLMGTLYGKDTVEMFITSIALAVSAIPEGLAVTITAILAVGMQRILKKKALVRKLVAAETLGSVTVICTDKTGTLTQGIMQVVKKDVTDEKRFIQASVLANDLMDPEEIVLWEYIGGIGGFDPQKFTEGAKKISGISFSSERKYMGSLNEIDGKRYVFIKGAPEIILKKSKLGLLERRRWEKKIIDLGSEGVRVFGFAYKKVSKESSDIHVEVDFGFKFLGIVGFFDPVRKSVKKSLRQCIRAGIDVKVITGDFMVTAKAIMKKIGIEVEQNEVMEGIELSKLSEEELSRRIGRIKLFARVSPSDKLKIVNALKGNGEVVAMTGDGINDAPALKRADIGIVVGGASEVSREAADLVLLDSNFATIVDAVAEGRGIFDNLRKIILYLLSDSFTEIILVVGSFVLGLPLPVTAAQILWVNLIDDGLPNMSLVFEPRDPEIMSNPPKDRKTTLFDVEIKALIAIISIVSGVGTLIIFYYLYNKTSDLSFARTVAFTSLGIDSLLYVFSSRSLRHSIFKTNLINNKLLIAAVFIGFIFQLAAVYLPAMNSYLDTEGIGLIGWTLVLVEGLLVVLVIELTKLVFLRARR